MDYYDDKIVPTLDGVAIADYNDTANHMITDDYDYNHYPTGDYNLSEERHPHKHHSPEENAMRILSIVIYSIIFLLGTLGNALVIWVTGFKMKRTVNSVWFLALAITDFLFSLCLPFSIVYAAMNFHWPFGKYMCKINSTFIFSNMFSSVFLLTIISIDRCISVIFPVWSQNNRNPRMAFVISLGACVLAFLMSMPSFIFRDTRNIGNGEIKCYNNFFFPNKTGLVSVQKSRHQAVVFTRFIFGFLIPFMLMVICYTIIALRITKHKLAKSKKPFKIIIGIIVIFFMCWIPYHVFSILETWHHHFSLNTWKIGMPITTAFATANSFMNPVLYVFMGEAFKKSLMSRLENAFSEDTAHSRINSRSRSMSKFSSDFEMIAFKV